MKKKPIIGIVIRCELDDEKSIWKLNEDYRLAVVKAGGIPLFLAPTNLLDYGKVSPRNAGKLSLEEREAWLQVCSLCDGILMTGGEKWYDFDQVLCQYAYTHDIPLLGICLGMQILGNMDSFDQEKTVDRTVLNQTVIEHCQPGVPYVHQNVLFPGLLRTILETDQIQVNSRHHYHIEAKDWFVISSMSEDGLIEGIEFPERKFMIGVQWHPESMLDYDSSMIKIFQAFVRSCQS